MATTTTHEAANTGAAATLPAAKVGKAPPRVSAEAEILATRIERAIRRKTNDKVRALRVEVSRDTVVLAGRCATFYCKQLAQQAAMTLVDGRELQDLIEVW
ncbi:MAG: BON domain-containing protein [Planctomycetia bacterium]|nr:BON domain-containing protein [Planctomycetia bacterium]